MTTSLWIVLVAAVIAAFGTIYNARVTLRNSQDTLKQSLDLRMREVADENRQEADRSRETERGSNLAEAMEIRKELKEARDEMRHERDKNASDLRAERNRALEVEQFAIIERTEFRAEISVLQAAQREIDIERAQNSVEREQNKQIIEALKKQHCAEIAKYKKELLGLNAKIAKMEARIKELEAGKAGG